MIQNFLNSLRSIFYVQIWENQIKVTDITTGKFFDEKAIMAVEKISKGEKVVAFGNKAMQIQGNDIQLICPFSHPRVLFSDFSAGVILLNNIFEQLFEKKLFKASPQVVIHPMEKTEGGLTLIEERTFQELALGAGARDVVVYQGSPLQIHGFNFEKIKASENVSLVSSKSSSWLNMMLWFLIIIFLLVQIGNKLI